MSKSCLVVAMIAALASVAAAAPAAAGDDAAACRSGEPAVQVRVSGFKRPSGRLKVMLYDDEGYLKRGHKLSKASMPVQSLAPIDLCLAVPRPGRYAVVVHHDINGNGDKDLEDGGGYSRNPRLSLTNLKVPFGRAAIMVGEAPLAVAIQLQYRRGLAVGPVA